VLSRNEIRAMKGRLRTMTNPRTTTAKTATPRPPTVPLGAAEGNADEVHTVAIRDLLLLPDYQCRFGVTPRKVREYATAIRRDATFPPILVARVNGAAIVVDGWHRVHAHEDAGRSTIEAIVVDATAHEAQRMAATANTTHGLPLKPREKHRAFNAFMSSGGHIEPKTARWLSYREIAAALGGTSSHNTIANWMRRDFPNIARAMGPGGEPTEAPRDSDHPSEDEQMATCRRSQSSAAVLANRANSCSD